MHSTAVMEKDACCPENYRYGAMEILRMVKFLLAGGLGRTSWRR